MNEIGTAGFLWGGGKRWLLRRVEKTGDGGSSYFGGARKSRRDVVRRLDYLVEQVPEG